MRCENIWKDRGFICFIFRHPTFDTFNGYIVIPPLHPWYNKHYDSIDVQVHGGLTFSDEIKAEYKDKLNGTKDVLLIKNDDDNKWYFLFPNGEEVEEEYIWYEE